MKEKRKGEDDFESQGRDALMKWEKAVRSLWETGFAKRKIKSLWTEKDGILKDCDNLFALSY